MCENCGHTIGVYDVCRAVFHVRIAEPDLTQTQHDGFHRQSAQVLNVLKRSDGSRSATISFFQNLSGPTDPYEVGEGVGWHFHR